MVSGVHKDVSRLVKQVESHDGMLRGAGREDGINTRIAMLEAHEAGRQVQIKAIWCGLIALIGKVLYELAMK